MAFDWTQVEGYREDMTADEKLALLDNYEPKTPEPDQAPDPTKLKGYVSKAQFDKVTSDLAAAKKQLRSRMSEDEQKEADRAAQTEAMEAELKTLRHEKAVSTYKAQYLAQGYDEKMAEEAATAMADGDNDAVFAVMKKHQTEAEKQMRQRILKETPVPPAGDNRDPEDEETKKEKKREEILRKSMGLPPKK